MHNNVDLISENHEDIATLTLQFRRFQSLQSDLTTVLRETLSNIYKYFTLPEIQESLTYIFAADSIWLCIRFLCKYELILICLV